ncbi:MAG: hypothetical protein IJZ68_06250 [Bacteroidaceae bacterium]|nr:hypothetical protein [Bacteroidaceae bacterium]
MRRLIAALLTLCLLSSSAVFAAEALEIDGMTVVYGVDAEYTVVIPDSIEVDTFTGIGTGEISITGCSLPQYSFLILEVNSANAEGEKWYLTGEDGTTKLEYTITSTLMGDVLPGDYFWCSAEYLLDLPLTETCVIQVADTPTIAGTYTDMLTYTIGVAMIEHNPLCYVCGKEMDLNTICSKCSSWSVCEHICSRCPTCPDCYAHSENTAEDTYYHCGGCDQCIHIEEIHMYCTQCETCVSEPDYCYDCNLCIWCDTEH